MAVVADVEAVMVMGGGRGRLVLVVMGMAVMVVRMTAMLARDSGQPSRAGWVGYGRTEPEHRQRKQADQKGPYGCDSRPHHPEPYKRTVKAR